jgi:hypothetical protein
MRRSLVFLGCWFAILAFAVAVRGAELCDILYNDKTPVDLGHAKDLRGQIEWTSVKFGSAGTFNKPPYWYQAKIKPCTGEREAAAVPVAVPLGPEAFGVACKQVGGCSVTDVKVFKHFAPSAEEGDAVQFNESKDKVEIRLSPKIEAPVEAKGKGRRVVVIKDAWTSSVTGKGS